MTDIYQLFEKDLTETLGAMMIENTYMARRVWSSLANVRWMHPEHEAEIGYTFRSAAGLVARIRGDGSTSIDWYCCGPYADVDDIVARSMRSRGWWYDDIGHICDEEGCIEPATCGTPTEEGYRSTCGEHRPCG